MASSNASTLRSVREFYDDVATVYDASRIATPYQRLLSQLDGGVVFSGVLPGRALEVGPGTGRITARLLERGLAVTAVDLSEGMLAQLRRRLPSVDTVACEVGALSRVEGYGTFDNAVSCRMLPHVPDAAGALRALALAVRPGGRVIFDLWNSWGYVGLSRRLGVKQSKVYTHFHSPLQARRMIADVGLRIARVRGVGFGPVKPYVLEVLGETRLGMFAHMQMFVCERSD